MARSLQKTVDVQVTVAELAKLFANMDSREQAEFFDEVRRIMHTWPTHGRDMQVRYLASALSERPESGWLIAQLADHAAKLKTGSTFVRVDLLAAAMEEIANARQLIAAMRAAAPVMLTVLALLADEADIAGLREIGIWYTEHSGCDHLSLWLNAERANDAARKAADNG